MVVVVWLSTEELVILFWSPWKNTKSKPMPLLSLLPLAAANPIFFFLLSSLFHIL